MRRGSRVLRTALLMVLAGLPVLGGRGLWAQTPWNERGIRPSIAVELQKPNFEGDNFSFATGVAFVQGRVPAGAILLTADLPMAGGSASGASSTVIGNPYLGVELRGGGVTGELGVRLPTANLSGDDDFAVGVGLYSDFDRFEAFVEDLTTFRAAVRFERREATGIGFGGMLAPALMVPKDGEEELFLGYGAQASYAWGGASVGAELTGRALVTESGPNFGERTVHQMALGGGVDLGRWRPGAFVRLPLDDDLSQSVDLVFGLTFAARF